MTKVETTFAIRHEPMRIAGKKVDTEGRVEVHYPWNDAVIGTVPAGNAEHARKAFEIAAAYQPKLTRYERQRILLKAAELLGVSRPTLYDLMYRFGLK